VLAFPALVDVLNVAAVYVQCVIQGIIHLPVEQAVFLTASSPATHARITLPLLASLVTTVFFSMEQHALPIWHAISTTAALTAVRAVAISSSVQTA
jgi:hypothetical protein